MILSAVVAMTQKRVIGRNNQLPWHLPEDLRFFRNLTRGHTVIMGRKTFDSIGKPLPQRENIVISRRQDFNPPGVQVVASFEEALGKVQGQKEVFVIGGAEIYRLALPFLDRIYLTLIDKDFEGDSYLPEWPADQFIEVYRKDCFDPFHFSFITLDRKR